jgi:heavy metal efflux system protein
VIQPHLRKIAAPSEDCKKAMNSFAAVMDGIIVLSQYNRLIDAGAERWTALVRTGQRQMRPVLMTCVIAGVGLLPAALSTGIGSQVQRPLAVVVVGGMALAPLSYSSLCPS